MKEPQNGSDTELGAGLRLVGEDMVEETKINQLASGHVCQNISMFRCLLLRKKVMGQSRTISDDMGVYFMTYTIRFAVPRTHSIKFDGC